jgi:hypothetical protein
MRGQSHFDARLQKQALLRPQSAGNETKWRAKAQRQGIFFPLLRKFGGVFSALRIGNESTSNKYFYLHFVWAGLGREVTFLIKDILCTFCHVLNVPWEAF